MIDFKQRRFASFDGHLDFAKQMWQRVLTEGDLAVDATCGNGHDTLTLVEMGAEVIACDLQQAAIEATRAKVMATFFHGCHLELAKSMEGQPKLVVYNLGYLPGADKTITTQTASTVKSVQIFLTKLSPGGLISITCYPGHEEGAKEEEALVAMASSLDPHLWSVTHLRWLNRRKSPSLLLIQSQLA